MFPVWHWTEHNWSINTSQSSDGLGLWTSTNCYKHGPYYQIKALKYKVPLSRWNQLSNLSIKNITHTVILDFVFEYLHHNKDISKDNIGIDRNYFSGRDKVPLNGKR